MDEPAFARMWEFGGRWYAQVLDAAAFIEVTGTSKRGCLDELRKLTGDDVDFVVEVVPSLAGRGRVRPRSWAGTSAASSRT